jgi:DNA/RNA endonuclease G (NUC1)
MVFFKKFIAGCLLALLFVLSSRSQVRVIDEQIYKLHYDFGLKAPLYVVYSIHYQGGDCDRKEEQFRFKADNGTATNADYLHSNYQKGQLAPAQDFAYSCPDEEKTFLYYNCMPQTGRLNTGAWKALEIRVRAMSQRERLTIVCGGIYGNEHIGDGVSVPTYCWKIIYHQTGSTPECYLFPNDNTGNVQTIGYSELVQRLGYRPVLN